MTGEEKTMRVRNLTLSVLVLAVVMGFAMLTEAAVSLQDRISEQAAKAATRVTVAKGMKKKISGVIIKREADLFTLRAKCIVELTIKLTISTKVLERKSNIICGANDYGVTCLVQGLTVQV